MDSAPRGEKGLSPFEIKQLPGGKFVANLPGLSMDMPEGGKGIVGWTKEEFDTKEEAETAIAESKKQFEGEGSATAE